MPEAALDNWQPVWNAQVPILFNFDALAQENAYINPQMNR